MDIKQQLEESDRDMLRVIEDIIDVLLKHSVIKASEFSDEVRAKLEHRKALRSQLNRPSRCEVCNSAMQINGRFSMCINYNCAAYGILIG